MKHFRFLATLIILATLAFTACGGSSGSGSDITNIDSAASSLFVSKTTIAPGAECANGGLQIDMGFDNNKNNVLDAGEITNTEYVCNGKDYDHGIAVTGVSLNKSGTSIFTGETEQLTSEVLPADATNPNVSWLSSDESVASVSSSGLVTAVGGGKAAIIVITKDGVLTDTCMVTVKGAGTKTAYTAGGITFNMAFVPGGLSFKTGVNDDDTATVANAYWIAETEVAYELWFIVRTWARANGYTLDANPGREGHDGTISAGAGAAPTTDKYEPVTEMNWREAMVWCNALTEWYNANNGTAADLDCVYYTDSAYTTPIRAADGSATITDTTPGTQDAPYVKDTAKGFRLLTSSEWELAARYKANDGIGYEYPIASGNWWTPGNYASGAYGPYTDFNASDEVAWFGNSPTYGAGNAAGTKPVRSKIANALGIYNMSGNVWEWCFTAGGSDRVLRGGSWSAIAAGLQVGNWLSYYPYYEFNAFGFRFARTQ